jgi:hypothetical protein
VTLEVLGVVNDPKDFNQVVFDAVNEIVAGASDLLVVGHTIAAEL